MTSERDHSQILYPQVEATLRELIQDVEFGPGEEIPPERELSKMLGVSRMTVRRAIENLIQQGLLERRSTTGTFVCKPQIVIPIREENIHGLSQMLVQAGLKPGSKLISFETMRAPRKVAKNLKIRIGQFVVSIRRLRLADGAPFCIETVYIAADLVPGLTAEDLENEISLYRILRKRFDIRVPRGEGIIKLSYASPEEALLLGLEINAPVLFRSAVSSDADGNPVEYLISVHHPDAVVFHTARSA